ncbi:MAG: hypothetical protein P8I83_03855 [Paracoccaceae bacterium]|nr:hypothetical protein [Paracoccaceae bacterium]
MAAMTALFGVAGTLLAGFEGLFLALVFAACINLLARYNFNKMVLRMYVAKEVSSGHTLHNMVVDLSLNANFPTPKVY